MANKRKLILIIGVILLISLGYGYFEYNKTHRNIEDEQASVQIESVDLFAAYESDEMQANKKYLDRVILVSGRVTEIEKGSKSSMIVLHSIMIFLA